MLGERVAHYEIVEQLGRGGMGVVYRATDTKLGRQVALKFLPDSMGQAGGVLDRFTREARSAAALNHPHICTIYEIGEHAGRPFIAMELLAGRTLADQIGGRPLPIGVSIDLAMQISSALEVAHTSGIIHRDIKPANIFVTAAGAAKILDFGLAKPLTPTAAAGSPDGATAADEGNLTGAGSTLGTIAYMSPEQARGQDLDGRSDVFSLGLVLYEMVTGRQAFAGETTAVVFDGILNRTPRAPSELNSDVPPDLERIIAKAIEKDRDARYQGAAELTADLRHLKRVTDSGGTLATVASMPVAGSTAWPSVAAQSASRMPAAPSGSPGQTQVPKRRWGTAAAAAAAVLLIAAGLAYWQLRDTSQALAESDRILIADFGNTTGDAMFDGTLKQALAVKLEESPFLNVVADQRVRETLAFMSRPADTPVTMGVAREICQRQGIKAVMLGDIAMLGSSFVVTLTAENCQNGEVLAREQVTAASKEQVLAAVGTAAATMREKLGESLASIEKMDKAIEQSTTSSLEALKAFALGDEKRNKGSDPAAIPFFKRALELDPDFAVAHARLGTVYSNLGETRLAIEHRTRAYELRERVSERERFYILGHYYSGVTREIDKALETYDLWKQTYPRDPVPYINSGTLYSQRGENERTIDAYSKALEIDPARRITYSNLFGKIPRARSPGRCAGAPRSADQEPRRNARDAVNVLRARDASGRPRHGRAVCGAPREGAADVQPAGAAQRRDGGRGPDAGVASVHRAILRDAQAAGAAATGADRDLVARHRVSACRPDERRARVRRAPGRDARRRSRRRHQRQPGVRLREDGRHGQGPPFLRRRQSSSAARRAAAGPPHPGLRWAPRRLDRPSCRGYQAAREPTGREPPHDRDERAPHPRQCLRCDGPVGRGGTRLPRRAGPPAATPFQPRRSLRPRRPRPRARGAGEYRRRARGVQEVPRHVEPGGRGYCGAAGSQSRGREAGDVGFAWWRWTEGVRR